MTLRLAGMRSNVQALLRPHRRLWQCGRGELGPQRRTCNEGYEQADRGDDCDGGPPSLRLTSAPRIHSACESTTRHLMGNPI